MHGFREIVQMVLRSLPLKAEFQFQPSRKLDSVTFLKRKALGACWRAHSMSLKLNCSRWRGTRPPSFEAL